MARTLQSDLDILSSLPVRTSPYLPCAIADILFSVLAILSLSALLHRRLWSTLKVLLLALWSPFVSNYYSSLSYHRSCSSLVVMGLGAGAIKANVSPLIAEQYQGTLRKETLPSGEVVIKSPAVTVQSIYLCKSL